MSDLPSGRVGLWVPGTAVIPTFRPGLIDRLGRNVQKPLHERCRIQGAVIRRGIHCGAALGALRGRGGETAMGVPVRGRVHKEPVQGQRVGQRADGAM